MPICERAIDEIRAVTDPLRVELMCAGTHPFARWDHQKMTNKARYQTLIDRTQWWGRQMLIYGVHVHVGIEDRDKVLPISAAMLSYYGHLQALSASSPFWGGEDTGYASNRALMFQQLPTAGLPFQFQQWSEFEAYVDDMLKTGVIDVLDEIRWDLRPSPKFGTLEVRVCDGIPNHDGAARASRRSRTAWSSTSRSELDDGRTLPNLPPWFAQENKWRSARYGMDAILILDEHAEEELVTTDLERLLTELEPVAERARLRRRARRHPRHHDRRRVLPASARRGRGERRSTSTPWSRRWWRRCARVVRSGEALACGHGADA